VTVGSLTENKNTILVLEAVNKLVKQGENIVLNIIGDGPCRPILKDIIKKYQLQNQVYLHGSLDPKEVYEFVSRSNIFVLSSFREGRPNVILESMALGTLVIASKIEGVEEVIENEVSGLLFNPYNYDELVECIKRVSNEIELQKVLPRNALEYIISNKLFWDETAKQYIELYKTVFTH
jgi:glycosyltransferase involved in cell wall biosynthesis